MAKHLAQKKLAAYLTLQFWNALDRCSCATLAPASTVCIRTVINKLWVTWAWHGIYEKIIFTPLKQPPCRKSGACTKAFIQCIPFKGQERKLRRWVIAKLVLKMCSYLLDKRGMSRRQGGELKQAQGRCKFQDPHVGRCYERNSSCFCHLRSVVLSSASTRGIQGRKEPYAIYPTYQFFARVGTERKKILVNKHLTQHLDFSVLVWSVLLNPKSTFLFRHEFWSGRYFSGQP